MRRRILIVLLALGTVGGYTSGFASLARRSRCHASWRGHTASPGGWSEARAPQACAPCPGAEAPPPAAPR